MAYQPASTAELLRYWGARKGTRALQDVLVFLYRDRGATDLGVYNRRPVRGRTSGWSLHSVGRAGDIGVRDTKLGDELFLRLIRAAEPLGLCEIIWNGQRWTAEKGAQPYNGADSHSTHLHYAQTREMADNPSAREALVKWYTHYITLP